MNPREPGILGERSYPSLLDIPARIDIVDVFRRAEDTPSIADDAVKNRRAGTVAAKQHLERGGGEKGRSRWTAASSWMRASGSFDAPTIAIVVASEE